VTARQAAIDLFKFWESRDLIITNAAVKRHLRDMKFSFRDSDVVIWLEEFRRIADKTKQERIDAIRLRRAPAGPTSAQDGPTNTSTEAEIGPTPAESGPMLRAHDKELLVTKNTASQLAPSLFAPDPPTPLVPRVDKRTGPEKVADSALLLLRPRIEPILRGMSWSTWRTRQRRFAIDMAQTGMTAEEIDDAHDEVSAQRGYVIWRLDWVQEGLTKRARIEVDDLPDMKSLLTPEARARLDAKIIAKRAEEDREEAERAKLYAV
jgi:hypothetical protein